MTRALDAHEPARVIIVGGPRCGKSTLARELAARGYPVFCGDPLSKVKEPERHVTYLPEGIPFSGDDGAAAWIVDNWFPMVPPHVLEGHVMARALRRWKQRELPETGHQWPSQRPARFPCDRIIVCLEPKTHQTPGQAAMTKAVLTVWNQISGYYHPITEYK